MVRGRADAAARGRSATGTPRPTRAISPLGRVGRLDDHASSPSSTLRGAGARTAATRGGGPRGPRRRRRPAASCRRGRRRSRTRRPWRPPYRRCQTARRHRGTRRAAAIRTYRAARRFLQRSAASSARDAAQARRRSRRAAAQRSRPRRSPASPRRRKPRRRPPRPRRCAGSAWRVVAWLALSLRPVPGQRPDRVRASVAGETAHGARPGRLAADREPTTVLILGSDARAEGPREPGAKTSGPSRSDSILLMRVGGGAQRASSRSRATRSSTSPATAATRSTPPTRSAAPRWRSQTVKQYLGIEINHVVEVDFENFPKLIDAMGGIDYSGGCVVSRINGGFRTAATRCACTRARRTSTASRRWRSPARARTSATRREDDLTRARRQQKILAAMKDARCCSPAGVHPPAVDRLVTRRRRSSRT